MTINVMPTDSNRAEPPMPPVSGRLPPGASVDAEALALGEELTEAVGLGDELGLEDGLGGGDGLGLGIEVGLGRATIRAPVDRESDGSSGTEGRKIVVSKMQSLRRLENLKRSQTLTAREERRKEEIMEIFHELYDISMRYQAPPIFPPWRPFW